MPQAKVYVVQEPLFKDRSGEVREKFSLTPAAAFGELVYVLNWSDPANLSAQQILWKIRREMNSFTKHDYLLMVGNPTAMALSAIVAAERADGCFKILYWDNAKGGGGYYRVEEVDVHAQPL